MRKCVSKPGRSAAIVYDLRKFENGHGSRNDSHIAILHLLFSFCFFPTKKPLFNCKGLKALGLLAFFAQ